MQIYLYNHQRLTINYFANVLQCTFKKGESIVGDVYETTGKSYINFALSI